MKIPPLVLIALSSLHFLPARASAQTVVDAKSEVDERIIDTSALVPLEKVAAPIPFKNFRYPYLNARGDVTFIGNDIYTGNVAKNNNGIYRSSATGSLKALAKQEDLAPDDRREFGAILGLQIDPETDDMVCHRGIDHGQGIYGIIDHQPLKCIAGLGTPAPDFDGPFKWFWYADIWTGWVVFNATVQKDNPWIHGLYLWNKSADQIWRVVDTNQTVPAANGRIGHLSPQPRLDKDWLVFSANRLDAKGEPEVGRGVLGLAAKHWNQGKPDLAPEHLQVLAPFGMIIPGSKDQVMTAAPNPLCRDGIIAFVAGSDLADPREESPEAYQAVCLRVGEGPWVCPLDTSTLIPGRPDGTVFTGFNKWLAISSGRVFFRAYGPGGYEAIYAYDPAAKIVYFIIDTLRQIDGKQPKGFEISTSPVLGNRIALMVKFKDQTAGEYLATMPGIPFTPKRR